MNTKIWERFENSKLAELYKQFDHQSPYHKEGTVYNHIKMVYDYCLENFKNDLDFEVLQYGCLYHDIGKCFTYKFNEEKGRATFYNHENVGVFYFDDYNIFNLDEETIIKIKKIIAYHDVYKYDIEKLKQMFNYEDLLLLLKFSECDNNGRITEIPHNSYNWKDLEYYEVVKEKKEHNLVLLVGLPGSGKSTFAKTCGYSIVERDAFIEELPGRNYREKWLYALNGNIHSAIDVKVENLIKENIKNNRNIVMDNCNLSKKTRNRIIHGHKFKNYNITMVVFTTSINTCIKRRSGDKTVPVEVIERFVQNSSLPTLKECDELIFI